MGRFRPEPIKKIALSVSRQPRYRRAIGDEAERVASLVRAMSPVRTGYYLRRVRAVGSRVHTYDVFWHLVEYGSIHNPPYAPLRRGVIASGLRFRPDPRP